MKKCAMAFAICFLAAMAVGCATTQTAQTTQPQAFEPTARVYTQAEKDFTVQLMASAQGITPTPISAPRPGTLNTGLPVLGHGSQGPEFEEISRQMASLRAQTQEKVKATREGLQDKLAEVSRRYHGASYHHLGDDQQGHAANLRLDAMGAPQVIGFNWSANQAELRPEQKAILDHIFQADQPTIHTVENRTDRSGPEALNNGLAKKRSQAVENYLRQKGASFADDYEAVGRPMNNRRDGYVVYSYR